MDGFFVLALSAIINGGIFIMLGADLFLKRYSKVLDITPLLAIMLSTVLYSILPLWSWIYYSLTFTAIYLTVRPLNRYEGFKIAILSIYSIAFLWEIPIHLTRWLSGNEGYILALPQIFALTVLFFFIRYDKRLYAIFILGICYSFGLYLDPYYDPYMYMFMDKLIWFGLFMCLAYIYRKRSKTV